MKHPEIAFIFLVAVTLACALSAPQSGSAPELTATRFVPAIRADDGPATSLVAATVTADALHVRQQPGVKALVIGYLYAGDQVTWTGSCSAEPPGWAEIAYLDGLAWVNARYLDKNICSEAK